MPAERYQPLTRLGAGGMGIVWLARDTYTWELVALKIMTGVPEDDRRDQKARERFDREIEIARSLQHPHVLPVIDYGEIEYDNRLLPYLVSPYMQEGSLADLIREKPPWVHWRLMQTADAILQAAQGLWYMHTRTPPIVHQDVKPANFLLRSVQTQPPAVHLYLCDFGISRKQRTPSAMASEVLGTFAYMAPEQADRKIASASDQYALAVMACLLLTGKLPLQASTNEEYIQAHKRVAPARPSALNPQRVHSAEIDAVILRALEKVPERRFPSILAFAEALQRAIEKQVQKSANAPTERLDPTVYPDGRVPIIPAIQRPPVESAFFSISLDPPEVDEGRILDVPLPVKPTKAPVPAKNESVPLESLPLKERIRKELPGRPKMLCWSPNGDYVACTLYGHAPLLIDRDGRVETLRTAEVGHAVCWSADAQMLAVSFQREVRLWNMATLAEWPLILPFKVRVIDGLDWSSHGQLAVWIDSQIRLYTLSPSLLAMQQPLPPQILTLPDMRCGNVGVLRWSPDGSLLAAGASNGALVCWDADTRMLQLLEPASNQRVYSLSWSPDGSLLAVAFSDKQVAVWNVGEKRKLREWENLTVMPRMVSVSIQRCLVLASNERQLLSWRLDEASPSGMLPGQLLAAWSPTRSELATLDAQKETVLVIWEE